MATGTTRKKTVVAPKEDTVEPGGGLIKTSREVVSENIYKMKLFSYIAIDIEEGATGIAVESIDGGDIYVTNELIGYENPETVVSGTRMEFDIPIVITADTVVKVKVTQLK